MEFIIPGPVLYKENGQTHVFHKLNGQKFDLKFFTSAVVRDRFYQNDPGVYDFINRYWDHLPANKQDEIFAAYQRLRAALDITATGEFNEDQLRQCAAEIVALHPIEDLKRWLTRPGIIAWPDERDLPRHYEQASSPKYPRDKTFILDDYQNLLAFILQMRPLVVLWGEFTHHHSDNISRVFSDMFRLRLLDDSNVAEGPGYKKLVEYSRAMLSTKATAAKSAVMESLSSEEFPEWLLANVIFRKLTTQSFRPPIPGDRSAFVVKHIASHIIEQLRQSERDFQTPMEKRDISEVRGRSEETQQSRFESIQARQALPDGDVTAIQWYMQDIDRLANGLEPNMPDALLKDFRSMFKFGNFIPQEPQVTVMLWVLAPVVSPRSENEMSRVGVAQGIAVASAVLWHRGHKNVAAILSATMTGNSTSDELVIQSASRQPKGIYKELGEQFPYQMRARGTDRSYKPVSDAIQEVTTEFNSFTWEPTLPDKYLNELGSIVTRTTHIKSLHTPPTLYADLHDMVIDLVARPLTTDAWKEADEIARKMGLM